MRPSPSTALAALALFVALGGGAYAAATIDTGAIKDRAVTAEKLAAGAVTTKKLALDAVTGKKANESTFGTVPSAASAGQLEGRTEFFVQLGAGGEQVVAQNGPLTARAQCLDGVGGNDVVRIVAETTEANSVLEGADNLNSAATGFLEPSTPADDRELVRNQAASGTVHVDNDGNEGFVNTNSGPGLRIDGDQTLLGLNYGGVDCRLAGVIEAITP